MTQERVLPPEAAPPPPPSFTTCCLRVWPHSRPASWPILIFSLLSHTHFCFCLWNTRVLLPLSAPASLRPRQRHPHALRLPGSSLPSMQPRGIFLNINHITSCLPPCHCPVASSLVQDKIQVSRSGLRALRAMSPGQPLRRNSPKPSPHPPARGPHLPPVSMSPGLGLRILFCLLGLAV